MPAGGAAGRADPAGNGHDRSADTSGGFHLPSLPAAGPGAESRDAVARFSAGPLYFCAAQGDRTPIVYEPRVEKLCRRHPEMGPCQYERDACRAKGGRVYTQKGEEVTMAVEAEYDRVVRRVRFQGTAGRAGEEVTAAGASPASDARY